MAAGAGRGAVRRPPGVRPTSARERLTDRPGRSRDALTEALAYYRDLGVGELFLERPSGVTPAPRVPAGDRALQLLPLAKEVAACRKCGLCETRTQTVFSDGSAEAKIVFVGEAPGADEDAQGIPFVGRAGQLLTKMIEDGMGLKRKDVYICNVLKCRPPENRNPVPAEIAACRGHLEAQIDIVRPEAIVALGKFAAQFLLDTEEGIMRLRGKWGTYRGIPVMPTFHPSFLLRQPDKKREAWEDLLRVLDRLGLSAPRRKGPVPR